MAPDLQKLTAYFAKAPEGTLPESTPSEGVSLHRPPEDISLADIDLTRLPAHVSIIMDGNGRWAQKRGKERPFGHAAGVASLREAVTTSVRLGIQVLSAYAFSTENWKRPEYEVSMLMHLFATTLERELPLFHQERVRLKFFGDIDALPKKTAEIFYRGLDETKTYDTMTFALAVNYGSRAEIVRAARLLAADVRDGRIAPEDIDDTIFSSRLYSADLPDPDLLIRTSGELRLSNYLLWQLAYSELYVTDVLWPDFSRWDYLRAIKSYQSRNRRFGRVQ